MKQTLKSLACVGLVISLAGCSSILSATRDDPIVDDRGTRTTGSAIDDSLISTKVDVNVDKAHPDLASQSRVLNVTYNGVVLLIGQVPRAELKDLAARAAQNVQRVKRVQNEITIGQPIGFAARSNDSLLTTKIKTQMLADSNIPGRRITVTTENGVVYLMGLLTRQEADLATGLVQGISGVQRIVRVFEYIN
ncbi:BON domain-containing protein [Atopomonas sediminilitoris]|uniref:BON domain-containing protein n=1 Tax=Atopomonas sediminilitoris TaxID=2919919 RepID=UPI001F4E6EF5|nr:BON domain-containing protein [Atopomonas sediminilitoris]MCJ8170681.1 BON domain-containing protein [Atopomonas sediminilitoris]